MSDPTKKKEKVLVIEGNGSFGEKLVDALNKEGYLPILVKNGTEGLKAIYDKLPHLILLDVVIPGGDGYEILEKKHSEPLLSKIPVFLLSTQGVPINMRRVPQDSVAEFVIALEPDAADIVDRVNRHFGHEAAGKPASDAGNTNSTNKKVLWVEDDKLIGTILAKKLVASGFDLFHAKNGAEGLEALKHAIPDVIVLDLLLPEMSGFDVLQKVREDDRFKKIPVLILSNLSKPSDIERAKVLGAQKFLVKAATSLDQIVAEIKLIVK